jgi:hypothetical protein
MDNQVTITPDENGNVLSISEKNPLYAHIRVKQHVYIYDDSGWLRNKELSALIHGETETMMNMRYEAYQNLPGNIIIKESLTPFSATDSDRDLKYAGKTGVICRVDDQPIYRKTFYTENQHAAHELIAHTNKEEIRAALAIQRGSSMMNSLKGITSDFVVQTVAASV